MPAAPWWEEAPDPWDVLKLGGRTVPGITEITGRAGRKIDIRSPPGGDGARVRDRGYEPAQLEARVRVWTKAQLEELHELLAEIHPRRISAGPSSAALARANRDLRNLQLALAVNGEIGNDQGFIDQLTVASRRQRELQQRSSAQRRSPRTPVDAAHPALSMLGIRSVYVTGVSLPKLERGELVTTINLVEWTQVPPPAPRPANTSRGLDGITDAFSEHRASRAPTATPPSRLR